MINNLLSFLVPAAYADDVVGTIALPSDIKIPTQVSQTGSFVTVIVRFFLIIGGLFTLWQFLSGGFTYISSGGDKAKVQEAGNKITMSIVGLVVMAASFVIIAIISKLLFGSFTAILAPTFTSVEAPTL